VCSVTANTRHDGNEFLEAAARIPVQVSTVAYGLDRGDQALADLARPSEPGSRPHLPVRLEGRSRAGSTGDIRPWSDAQWSRTMVTMSGTDGTPKPKGVATGQSERASPHTPVAGHGHSFPIGRVAAIPIRLHWSFFLLIALVATVDWSAGGSAVVFGLAWIVALFTSVVAHEVAHCIVARRRGALVLGIVLFPLGGMSQLETMPKAPNDELAVAIVGPLTSLGIGLLLLVAGLVTGAHVWPPTLFVGNWCARLGWLNLLLGAFNLLPALPMDGGRVLRAALARHRSHLEATIVASRIARYLGTAMVVAGFLYDSWLILIGVFVLMGARAEEEAARHPSRRKGQATDQDISAS
jgi:Zn-dependent protease